MRTYRLLFILALAICIGAPLRADLLVTMDTSVLQGIGGSWYLDFELDNDDAPTVNTVTISNIDLGGGSQTGTDTLTGDASGTFPSYTLTEDPANFINQVLTQFTAGTQVQFDLAFTNNYDGSGMQDTFSWAVLDSSFNPIVTDPNSLGAGLVFQMDGTTNITTVAADAAIYDGITPDVTPINTGAVPEPATGGLVVAGLLALAVAYRQARLNRSPAASRLSA
jgi:hypothetical protein